MPPYQPPHESRTAWSMVEFDTSPDVDVWVSGPHNNVRVFVKEYGASWVLLTADYGATLDLTDPFMFATEQGGTSTSPGTKAAIFQLLRVGDEKLVVTITQSASDGDPLDRPNGDTKWYTMTGPATAYDGITGSPIENRSVGTAWQFDTV